MGRDAGFVDATNVDAFVNSDARPNQDSSAQDAGSSADAASNTDGPIVRDAFVRDATRIDNGIAPVVDGGTILDSGAASCPSFEGMYRLAPTGAGAACAPALQCIVSNQNACDALITCAPPGAIGPPLVRIAFQSIRSDMPRFSAWQGNYRQGTFRVYSNDMALLVESRSCIFSGSR